MIRSKDSGPRPAWHVWSLCRPLWTHSIKGIISISGSARQTMRRQPGVALATPGLVISQAGSRFALICPGSGVRHGSWPVARALYSRSQCLGPTMVQQLPRLASRRASTWGLGGGGGPFPPAWHLDAAVSASEQGWFRARSRTIHPMLPTDIDCWDDLADG